jgi:hypothetical protein
MSVRIPLVNNNGLIQQLQSPDSIPFVPRYSQIGVDADSLAYMRFAEATGATSFKNEVTGTYDFSVDLGSPVAGAIGPQGQPGGSGAMSGSIWIPGATSNIRIISADGAFEPANRLTINTLINISTFCVPPGFGRVVTKPAAPTSWIPPYQIVTLCFDPSGMTYFALSTDGVTAQAASIPSRVLPFHQWALLSGTYDGANLRLYLNGRPVGTTPATTGNIAWPTDGNTAPWVIGEPNPLTGEGFDGYVSSTWIDGVARSQSYLENLWDAVAPRF